MDKMKVEIELEPYTRRQYDEDGNPYGPPMTVTEAVVERAAELLAAQMKERVEEKIDALVTATAKDLTETAVNAQIAAVIERGWPHTDEYGRPKGTGVTTVADLVLAMLTSRDRYGSSGRYIDNKVAEVVNAALAKDLAEVVEAAKQQVKDALAKGVATKIAEMVRV